MGRSGQDGLECRAPTTGVTALSYAHILSLISRLVNRVDRAWIHVTHVLFCHLCDISQSLSEPSKATQQNDIYIKNKNRCNNKTLTQAICAEIFMSHLSVYLSFLLVPLTEERNPNQNK